MSALIANAMNNYFKDTIEPKDWAKFIRKYNFAVTDIVMRMQAKTGEILDIDPIIDGVYYTNAIAELIDPYLED